MKDLTQLIRTFDRDRREPRSRDEDFMIERDRRIADEVEEIEEETAQ